MKTPTPLNSLLKQLATLDRIDNTHRKQRDSILLEVGYAMRHHREAAKISLRKLATKLGISAAHLSDMERGTRKYSREWCKKTMSILER